MGTRMKADRISIKDKGQGGLVMALGLPEDTQAHAQKRPKPVAAQGTIYLSLGQTASCSSLLGLFHIIRLRAT